MKSALIGSLAVSLAGNVALFALLRPTHSGQPANREENLTAPRTANAADPTAAAAVETAAARPTASPAGTAPDTARRPMRWRNGASDDALRSLADDLRAAGFPPRAIFLAVNSVFEDASRASSPLFQAPYWQNTSLELQKAEFAHQQQRREVLDDILGPDISPAVRLTAEDRQRRFGNLSDEKINAITRFGNDYSELHQNVNSEVMERPSSQESYKTYEERQKLLQQEFAADLATVLTPAEIEAYEMRTSQSAYRTSSRVRDIAISEAEYTALYQQEKNFEAAYPSIASGTTTAQTYAERQVAYAATNEQARATLGDERFFSYLSAKDSNYRDVTRLSSQFPQVTAQSAYAVTQLQVEAQQLIASLQKERPSGEQIVTRYAELNARLEALIGRDAATAIRKTNTGRYFIGPTGSATSPVPARK
ncbi:hypothetical protein [Oleiharenicola lentus]|uniref:hypothetical protein n=1 Tax=Oleiharenicola lentus TaxID=2508720 RepID=UPI003F66C94B